MKKSKIVWKRFLLWIGAAAMLLSAGCRQRQAQRQPYTDQYTVQLLETASSKTEAPGNKRLKDMLSAPDRYVANIAGVNGKLIVNANIPLILPDADAVPVVRVKGADFTQDQVYRAFQHLCADEPMVLLSDTGDKTDIIADGTLQKMTHYENGVGSAILGQYEALNCVSQESHVDGGRKIFFVSNNTVYREEVSYYLPVEGGEITVCPETCASFSYLPSVHWVPIGRTFGGELIEDVTGLSLTGGTIPSATISTTPMEARNAAEAFLANCGIGALTIDGIWLYRNTPPVGAATPSPQPGAITPTPTLPSQDTRPAANATDVYVIRFLRKECGMRVESIEEDLDIQIPGFEAGANWRYEQATMNITDDGVMWFNWQSPLETTEIVTENAALLPWNKIQDIFERIVPVKYAETAGSDLNQSMTITVERIELCLTRIIDQNSYNTGLLIPAWNFYGSTEMEGQAGNRAAWPMDSRPLLSINAIDGGVISSTKGY